MGLKDNFRKRFIAAESDGLVIETIQTISKTELQKLRLLKLKGTWRANEYNELVFEASVRRGPPQTYTFRGSWKINDNQQIEYTSEDGGDRLTFKGYWQLSAEDRLTYIFEGSSTSRFEFKVQLESPILYPKKGEIRYRIGVGARQIRKPSSKQLIILYGEWKFGRNLGLSFRMDYGNGRIRALEFGAEVSFEHSKVIFALNNEFGKPVGITITMTHRFLKSFNAEAFIRLKAIKDEYGVDAGVSIPF